MLHEPVVGVPAAYGHGVPHDGLCARQIEYVKDPVPPPHDLEHDPESCHPPPQSTRPQQCVLHDSVPEDGQLPPHEAGVETVNVAVRVPPPQLAEHAP